MFGLLPGGYFVVSDRSEASRLETFRPSALAKVCLPSRDQYWDEYWNRFRSSVSRSIESDSPVVAELSGGLDSSSIVCMADRILGENSSACPSLVAAAGLYPGLACDEEPFIRAVERHVNISVECWDATDVSVNELEPSSVALPGGRFATFGGTEGQLHIAQALHANVLVSGFGGDQVGTPSGGLRDAVTELRWRDASKILLGRPRFDPGAILETLGALARSFMPLSLRRGYGRINALQRRPNWLGSWAKTHRRLTIYPKGNDGLESEIQRRMWRSLSAGPHALVMTYLQHHAIRNGLDSDFRS